MALKIKKKTQQHSNATYLFIYVFFYEIFACVALYLSFL